MLLQSQDLRVGQVKEPCIRLIQENLIENSVQDCLPYIQIPNGLYKLFLAYPKWPCICLKVNMCITHCITSSFLEYSTFFYISCNLWLWLLPYHLMWLICNQVMLSLTLTLSSKNRKMKLNQKKKQKKNKKN